MATAKKSQPLTLEELLDAQYQMLKRSDLDDKQRAQAQEVIQRLEQIRDNLGVSGQQQIKQDVINQETLEDIRDQAKETTKAVKQLIDVTKNADGSAPKPDRKPLLQIVGGAEQQPQQDQEQGTESSRRTERMPAESQERVKKIGETILLKSTMERGVVRGENLSTRGNEDIDKLNAETKGRESKLAGIWDALDALVGKASVLKEGYKQDDSGRGSKIRGPDGRYAKLENSKMGRLAGAATLVGDMAGNRALDYVDKQRDPRWAAGISKFNDPGENKGVGNRVYEGLKAFTTFAPAKTQPKIQLASNATAARMSRAAGASSMGSIAANVINIKAGKVNLTGTTPPAPAPGSPLYQSSGDRATPKDAAAGAAGATAEAKKEPGLLDTLMDLLPDFLGGGKGKPGVPGASGGGILSKAGNFIKGAAGTAASYALPAAVMYGAGRAIDYGAGALGVGKDEKGNDLQIDQKADDANWKRMNWWQTGVSSVARGIEKVGDVITPNLANQARSDRVKAESEYFAKQDGMLKGKMPAATPTKVENTTISEKKTRIAGEDVGDKLSDKQMSVIGMSKSMGNSYSPEIEAKYQQQLKNSKPEANKTTPSVDPNDPNMSTDGEKLTFNEHNAQRQAAEAKKPTAASATPAADKAPPHPKGSGPNWTAALKDYKNSTPADHLESNLPGISDKFRELASKAQPRSDSYQSIQALEQQLVLESQTAIAKPQAKVTVNGKEVQAGKEAVVTPNSNAAKSDSTKTGKFQGDDPNAPNYDSDLAQYKDDTAPLRDKTIPTKTTYNGKTIDDGNKPPPPPTQTNRDRQEPSTAQATAKTPMEGKRSYSFSEMKFAQTDNENYRKYQDYKEKVTDEDFKKQLEASPNASMQSQQIMRQKAMMTGRIKAQEKFKSEATAAGAMKEISTGEKVSSLSANNEQAKNTSPAPVIIQSPAPQQSAQGKQDTQMLLPRGSVRSEESAMERYANRNAHFF
jgi:hypothetical protein